MAGGRIGMATWATSAALIDGWTELTHGLGTPRSLAAGDVLFQRDDPSHGLYLLREGLTKAYGVSAAGQERLVEIMGAGSLFGEGTALEGGPRLVTVVALSALRVVFYRVGDVQDALRRDPRIGLCLIQIMAAKQRSLAHRLIEASSLPPRARLLDLLERLRDARVPAGRRALELPLTHEDLAGYLGLSRVTVTRAVNGLRREGLLAPAA